MAILVLSSHANTQMHDFCFFNIGEKEEIRKQRKEMWAIGLENSVCEKGEEGEP